MFFSNHGKGDDHDPRQDNHILSNPSRDPVRNAPPPQKDMRQDVMAFTRKLQYDNLVKAGTHPANAIRQVVPTVKSGIMLTPKDIKQIIDTGSVKKSRVG